MVVNFIRKCCWLLGSQLSTDQYNAIVIAIAIVDSRSGCSRCGVPVVVLEGKEVATILVIMASWKPSGHLLCSSFDGRKAVQLVTLHNAYLREKCRFRYFIPRDYHCRFAVVMVPMVLIEDVLALLLMIRVC